MVYVSGNEFFQQVTLPEVWGNEKIRICEVVYKQLRATKPMPNELPFYAKGALFLLRRGTLLCIAEQARNVLHAAAEYYVPWPAASFYQKLMSLHLHILDDEHCGHRVFNNVSYLWKSHRADVEPVILKVGLKLLSKTAVTCLNMLAKGYGDDVPETVVSYIVHDLVDYPEEVQLVAVQLLRPHALLRRKNLMAMFSNANIPSDICKAILSPLIGADADAYAQSNTASNLRPM